CCRAKSSAAEVMRSAAARSSSCMAEQRTNCCRATCRPYCNKLEMEGDDVSIGPVELIMVKFPGNQLRGGFGELARALKDLVESNTVRVIDLVIMRKDAAGKTESIELTSLAEDQFSVFESLVDEVLGLISADQMQRLSDMLENNSAGAIML